MSTSQNSLSKKIKIKKNSRIWKFCLLEFFSCCFFFIFLDCFLLHFSPSSAQVILPQLSRIFNNPFASLLSPHKDLIEFHNLSNIAVDENVLWPRWHIGLHLKGFRAADKVLLFFFGPAAKNKTTKSISSSFSEAAWTFVFWKCSSFVSILLFGATATVEPFIKGK